MNGRAPAAVLMLAAVLALVASQFVLAGAIFCMAIIWLAVTEFRRTAGRHDSMEDLSPEARSKILPLRRAVDQIEELTRSSQSGDPAIAAVARDAFQEALRIRSQVIAIMVRWDELHELRRATPSARSDLAALRARIEAGDRDPNLEGAVVAKESEIAAYEQVNAQREHLSAQAERAGTAVAQLAANLGRAIAAAKTSPFDDDPLRENLMAMKALEGALDEVQNTESR
jgi:hypothetical protein